MRGEAGCRLIGALRGKLTSNESLINSEDEAAAVVSRVDGGLVGLFAIA